MRSGFSELQNGAVIPNGILWFTHVRGGYPIVRLAKVTPHSQGVTLPILLVCREMTKPTGSPNNENL
ncbi:hypothetical protein PV325_001429 [Microctonus aethiopoides]|nr:hypothetical protein PV325_001429 [Microctonus aethiopoides]